MISQAQNGEERVIAYASKVIEVGDEIQESWWYFSSTAIDPNRIHHREGRLHGNDT